MRALFGSLLAALLLGAGPSFPAPASADGVPLPLPTSPEGDAPGVNDWSCRPAAAHPRPVVLVHGTFGDRKHLLENLSAALVDEGYCVFSLDYGNRATGPIERSAEQLSAFVDRVLAETGAAKVSIVGHSQGGMMPRYYIKFLGGADKVDDLVGLAPSNHGTSQPLAMFPGVDYLCPACKQQQTGSEFLRNLSRSSEWLEKPDLIEVKLAAVSTNSREQRRLLDFSMKVSIKTPVVEPASGASAPKKG